MRSCDTVQELVKAVVVEGGSVLLVIVFCSRDAMTVVSTIIHILSKQEGCILWR